MYVKHEYLVFFCARYYMNKKATMNWVTLVSFGVLAVGGLNFLLMGLFQFDLFAAVFGGTDAVVSRIIYSIFGIAAVTLVAIVLWKAFMSNQIKKKPATRTTSATA